MTEKKRVVRKRTETPKPTYELVCDQQDYLDSIGLDMEWLANLSDQYGFDKIEYVHKFRAFRCYKQEQHVEWTDVNELAILNGKRPLDNIMQKHQPLGKARQIIYRPWR